MIESFGILASMLEKVGLAALVILSYRAILRSRWPDLWAGPAIGVLFSLGAAITMIDPLVIGPGIVVDIRVVMVGLAALFGGLWAALIACVVAVAVRIFIGGAGVLPGTVSIVVAALIALAFVRIRGSRRDLGNLALLGLAISLSLSSVLLMPFDFVVNTAAKSLPALIVRNVLGTMILGYLLAMEERREAEHKTFKQLAERDALTGLSNRRALEVLERRNPNQETPELFCVIMFDLDHFKTVNDTHGHSCGDVVLARFAEIISRRIRGSDLVVRYGGEEFCVILNDALLSNAARIAEDIRGQLAAEDFANGVTVTVSAGVAQSSENEPSVYTVIKNADKALYEAKRNGRNRVEIHTE
ncbi:diguanylate cyclase [Martelella lutilitoris]|uniref:diguanylate cyclase n=1 Tax=Martelella lutilitoris TaxID=2583532 RepID=A0A5C4JRY1_9HYPH|nr:diguanylate cyclase [Martelella lutilitoris]TNB48027.1 diguanylate cyclase [Martelella lutilitoris]